ncbi:hypothetical protein [Kordia sp.]|uniref:hypothetical protein n=1 Tax=Kordia sp. TaxID=1965332 RepID=UPI003D2C93A7
MKKVFGYIFLVIGVFFGLIIFLQLPKIIKDFANASSTDTAYSFGYVMGKLVAMLITVAIIVLLIWLGRKWTKNTTIAKETKETKELQDSGKDTKK